MTDDAGATTPKQSGTIQLPEIVSIRHGAKMPLHLRPNRSRIGGSVGRCSLRLLGSLYWEDWREDIRTRQGNKRGTKKNNGKRVVEEGGNPSLK